MVGGRTHSHPPQCTPLGPGQGCISRMSVGNPAIDPPPSLGQNPAIEPHPRKKKIRLYQVLKGSKRFFGALGAEKHPYTLYFRVLLHLYV